MAILDGDGHGGDLFGNFEDLSETYEPGDVMPAWAIDNGGISAFWHRINDRGWVSGRAATGISDGAGHLIVSIVRFADPIGWTGMPPVSHLSLAAGINEDGDFLNRHGGLFLDEMGAVFSCNTLLAPEWQFVNVSTTEEINANRQIAGAQAHAFLLTPLGAMIIPGDVNGDVSVDPDDFCAWAADPIDLDGDGDADSDDGQWLIARLAIFGYTTLTACCPADITGATPRSADGNVDALDFLLLVSQWGTAGPEADITGPVSNEPDGTVDALDMLTLIAQWGSPAVCP